MAPEKSKALLDPSPSINGNERQPKNNLRISNNTMAPNLLKEEANFDWQSSKSNLTESFEFIFNNERYSDVHFIVGQGSQRQKIPAHKLVLCVRSVVFDTMFNQNWSSENNDIELPDVEPAAFLELLRFLYTDVVVLSPKSATAILYAAKKYAVPVLETKCVDYLKSLLCPKNAFTLLAQGRLFGEKNLVDACLGMIDKSASQAVKAVEFVDIDLETLCLVLKRDSFDVQEIELFEAVIRWSKAECARRKLLVEPKNQRLVLKDAISLIRFPLMSAEQFAKEVVDSGLLQEEDIISMLLYFTKKPRPSTRFLETRRCSPYIAVNGLQEISIQEWVCDGTRHVLRFCFSHCVLLKGIGFHVPFKDQFSFHSIHIMINHIQVQGGKLSILDEANYMTAAANIVQIPFKNPVEFVERQVYEITYGIKGLPTLCGSHPVNLINTELPNSIVFKPDTNSLKLSVCNVRRNPFSTPDRPLLCAPAYNWNAPNFQPNQTARRSVNIAAPLNISDNIFSPILSENHCQIPELIFHLKLSCKLTSNS